MCHSAAAGSAASEVSGAEKRRPAAGLRKAGCWRDLPLGMESVGRSARAAPGRARPAAMAAAGAAGYYYREWRRRCCCCIPTRSARGFGGLAASPRTRRPSGVNAPSQPSSDLGSCQPHICIYSHPTPSPAKAMTNGPTEKREITKGTPFTLPSSTFFPSKANSIYFFPLLREGKKPQTILFSMLAAPSSPLWRALSHNEVANWRPQDPSMPCFSALGIISNLKISIHFI